MSFVHEARGRLLSTLLALAVCGIGAHVADAAVTIDEFPLGATPTGIAAGPDGNMWVTTTAPSILRLSGDGAVTARYPLTATGAPRPSLPVYVGDALWYVMTRTDAATGTATTTLGRRKADGALTEFPIPTPTATVDSMTRGPDGNLWLTESGAKAAIGRVTSAGQVTEFPGIVGPSSIFLDATDQLWITQPVARVSTAGIVTPVDDPGGASAGTTGPLPTIWSVGQEGLCCYGPLFVEYAHWLIPGTSGGKIGGGFLSSAAVRHIAVGQDGNAWMTDANALRIGRVSTTGRTSAFTTGLLPDAQPDLIVQGPGETMWFTDDAGRVGRLALDRPTTTTEAADDLGQSGARVGAVVTPLGTASRVRFDYGTSTAYGASTRLQDVGDGDMGVTRRARLEGLEPGTTYHYRAAVKSAFGTTTGPDRTLTTQPLPPVPPPPPADADGDGYAAAIDCDDHSATAFPGADEIPGDGIDQDCSGDDEALPRFFPHITAYFTTNARKWSRFTSLTVDDVPAGAHVQLRCSGPGCRFTTWSTSVRRDVRALKLLPRLNGSKLGRSAVLELRLTLAGHLGTVVRWKVGPPPVPVVTCLRPRATKPRACA